MEHSTEIKNIATAMLEVMGIVAVKDKENSHLRSEYADICAVWRVLNGPLKSCGLTIMQFPGAITPGESKTCIEMVNMVMHTSGEWIRHTMQIPLPEAIVSKSGGNVVNLAQRMGSAITYARRYSLLAIFSMAPGDDDDANSAFPRPQQHVAPVITENATWQQLYRTGEWKKQMVPGDDQWGTFAELEPGELKELIKRNEANGFANACLVAAAATLVAEAAQRLGISVADGLKQSGWNGPTSLEDMQPQDLRPAYNAIVALKKS